MLYLDYHFLQDIITIYYKAYVESGTRTKVVL